MRSRRTTPDGWPEPDPFHPLSQAKSVAHREQCEGRRHDHRPCPAQPSDQLRAETWGHRARMAAARRAAGVPLDRGDRQALDRQARPDA